MCSSPTANDWRLFFAFGLLLTEALFVLSLPECLSPPVNSRRHDGWLGQFSVTINTCMQKGAAEPPLSLLLIVASEPVLEIELQA